MKKKIREEKTVCEIGEGKRKPKIEEFVQFQSNALIGVVCGPIELKFCRHVHNSRLYGVRDRE